VVPITNFSMRVSVLACKLLPALHLEMDNRYGFKYIHKLAKLFRKISSNKVNCLQLRLIPCFTGLQAIFMTDLQSGNTLFMAQKQQHFDNRLVFKISTHLILALDTPANEEDPMTLRRWIMKATPDHMPTQSLCLSIDKTWTGKEHVITTVLKYAEQTTRMITNMIPQCPAEHGQDARRWFSNDGLAAMADVTWNLTARQTSSCSDWHIQHMVEEDFFGMGSEWRPEQEATQTARVSRNVSATLLTLANPATLLSTQEHDDAGSLRSIFNRDKSDEADCKGNKCHQRFLYQKCFLCGMHNYSLKMDCPTKRQSLDYGLKLEGRYPTSQVTWG
jgi:hypothetical protein